MKEVAEYIDQLNQQINTAKITKIRLPEESCENSLCFATDQNNLEKALTNRCGVILVPQNLADKVEQGQSTVHSLEPFAYHQAKILEVYAKSKSKDKEVSIQSDLPTDIKIGRGVSIGPHTIIGKNVLIGDDVTIMGQVFIGDNCVIKSGTHIFPGVCIADQTLIGNNCIIHNNTSIGADGFGFTEDVEKGGILKVSQIGRVEIGDHVEIGSQCAIDCGCIGATRIGNHTKLDNFVHIAHNVQIGNHCLITAGFIIAGSSIVGDRFKCGGRTSVTGHIEICDDVTLAGVSVVTNNITKPGAYGGHPLQPMSDYLRTQSSFVKLPEIRKELKRLLNSIKR